MKAFKTVNNIKQTFKKLFKKGVMYDYYAKGYSDQQNNQVPLNHASEEFEGIPFNIVNAYLAMYQAGWEHSQESIDQWTREEVREYFSKGVPKQAMKTIKETLLGKKEG